MDTRVIRLFATTATDVHLVHNDITLFPYTYAIVNVGNESLSLGLFYIGTYVS